MNDVTKTESRLDPLLPSILSAIERAGISRNKFGYDVCGDPTLVLKMERGRRVKKPELRAAIKRGVAQIVAQDMT